LDSKASTAAGACVSVPVTCDGEVEVPSWVETTGTVPGATLATAATAQRDYAVLSLLARLGLRGAEAASLQLGDID
jgi:hypothetical protein